MKVPGRAKLLMTTGGFIDCWWDLIKSGMKGAEAWRMLEEEYKEYFDDYKYVSYESFYQVMYRRVRKEYENKTT